MFARKLATAAAITLVVGSACSKGPDDCFSCGNYDQFSVVARGANVIPAPAPADTSARAIGTFNSTTLAWTFNVSTPPSSGTIDSIAIYAMPGTAQYCAVTTCASTGTPAPGATNSVAAAVLCAGAAACAATSGTATLMGTTITASLNTLLRAYGGQLIVFTTTVRSGGVMRGTMYVTD
jgi:hypothetical protein